MTGTFPSRMELNFGCSEHILALSGLLSDLSFHFLGIKSSVLGLELATAISTQLSCSDQKGKKIGNLKSIRL